MTSLGLVRAAVLVAAAFFMPVAAAQAATPEESFRLGVAAVRGGDAEQAVTYFEAAREAGLDTGALHYNLAVAYYRAGRVDDAEQSFQRAAASERMAAPALFQLGRLARARGDDSAALDYFRRAAAEAETDAMRQRALAEVRGASGERLPDFVYAGFGGGHDSNVALTPSDASGTSEESDLFLEGLLVLREPVDARHYLRGSAYLQGFLDEDEFDLAVLRGGFGRIGRLSAGWRWDAWLDGRHRRLEDRTFDNALLAGVELRPPARGRWRTEFEYQLGLVGGGDRFEFLDGVDHMLGVRLDERGRAGWDLAASLGVTDRDDYETTDDFFSVSWTEIGLAIEYTVRLRAGRTLEFSGDWMDRDYDGTEVRNGDSLGQREDELLRIGLALDQPLDADWSVRVSAGLEERDSNLGEFDYERRLLRVMFDRLF